MPQWPPAGPGRGSGDSGARKGSAGSGQRGETAGSHSLRVFGQVTKLQPRSANAMRRWHEIAHNVLRFDYSPSQFIPLFTFCPLRGRQPHELPRNREHHRVIWVGACLCSRVPALALILGERRAALSHRARGAPHSVVMHNGAAGDGTVLPPP